MRAHASSHCVKITVAILSALQAACSTSSIDSGTRPACSRTSDGHCALTNDAGQTDCDVDRGPSDTVPDAAYFVTCDAGSICGIDHQRRTFSCCAPSADCVEGFSARD